MKKIITFISISLLAATAFAGYTKVIDGESINATITSTQKSLRQLIIDAGGDPVNPINPKAKRVLLSFDGDPADVKLVARFATDQTATIAAGTGRALISLEERIYTVEQFDSIFIAEAADINVFIEQFDTEQDRL